MDLENEQALMEVDAASKERYKTNLKDQYKASKKVDKIALDSEIKRIKAEYKMIEKSVNAKKKELAASLP